MAGYAHYLAYISGIALIVIIFMLNKSKKTKQVPFIPLKSQPIMGGSISIFIDQLTNVIIIPYVKDLFGEGRAIAEVKMLNAPYTKDELGKCIRQSMSLCEKGKPCTSQELMSRLNYRGWKEFSIGKRNISLHYNEKHGLVFNTTIRKEDGAYIFNSAGKDMTAKNDISNEDLGKIILDLLPRCR